MSKLPNPGSEGAQAQGCICPVISNCYGRGIRRADGILVFWMSSDCPVHNPKEKESCRPK